MKQFKRIYVEITNVCNLRCDFCPQTSRKPEFMNPSAFDRILEQIKPYTDYLCLHVKGEPLLHPALDEILDISGRHGFLVNITTNGTLIGHARETLLTKPALRQVNFSLHSLDDNNAPQHKSDYINAILSFTKEAVKQTKLLISLRLWNLTGYGTQHSKNHDLLAVIEEEFQLPYNIQEQTVPERGIKLAERVYLNQAQQFVWPDLAQKPDDGTGFCYGLRSQVAILVDGTVVPCCLDGEGVINLGNVHAAGFSQIIESARARDIVKGFANRQAVEELCKKCGYRKRFD